MKRKGLAGWPVLVSSLVYTGLLWFISGVLRTGGFFVFVAGVLLLAGCLVAARDDRRRPLFILHTGVLMCAAAVAGPESLLRLEPGLLSGNVANAAFGGYHFKAGGIFDQDLHLGAVLKPNFERDLYWQGHWWHHVTNAAGYRGTQVEQAEVVFLGDSMVYGHGVENEETVPSRFQAQSGRSTVNLGQSITCPIQMAMRYRRLGVPLRPRVVYLCSHFNDITDASHWYSKEELQRLVNSDPQEQYEALARPSCQPKPWWRLDCRWDENAAPPLRLAGALVGWQHDLASGALHLRAAEARASERAFQPKESLVEKPIVLFGQEATEVQQLGWRAHCQALAQINEMCKARGARLVLFDIGYPREFSQAIEDAAQGLGAIYSPAGREVYRRAQSGEAVYLANDGHWSPLGCKIIAEELQRTVKD